MSGVPHDSGAARDSASSPFRGDHSGMNRSRRQLPSTRNSRKTGTVSSNKIVTQSPSETAVVETFLEGLLIPPSDSRDRLFLNGNYASYQYQGLRQSSATYFSNTQKRSFPEPELTG